MANSNDVENKQPQHPSFYNPVFEKLVQENVSEDYDIAGLVAYGIYKLSKREWLLTHQDDTGAKPDAAAHEAFAKSQTPKVLEGYRTQANAAVANYGQLVVESQRPDIIRDALRGTFWQSVGASFVASLIFAALLALVVFIAAMNGFGLPISMFNQPPAP